MGTFVGEHGSSFSDSSRLRCIIDLVIYYNLHNTHSYQVLEVTQKASFNNMITLLRTIVSYY